MENRQKRKEGWFIHGTGNIIVFLSLLFILLLFWLSLVSTSVISPDFNEHTYFVRSSPLWCLGPVCVLLILILFRKRKTKLISAINENDALFHKILMILFLILAGVLSWWILYLSVQPKADQQLVMETVKHMRSGDFTDFETGGYVSMNHQQSGIVMMEYLLSFLCGTENYLAMELINVPGVILCYVMMERIMKETGASNSQRFLMVLFCLLFFPFSMYVVFVYGTVWGLAFALYSVYLEIRFFHGCQWKDLILCICSILMAVFLKSNYEIFLIAMVLCAISETIRQKKEKILILPVLLVVLLAGEHGFSEGMIHYLAGDDYAPPMSTWTWIAMGTSENQIMADGWYSDAIGRDIYLESDGDLQVDEILTKKIVQKNLKDYQNNPEREFRFLLKKTASQWNNPTFQGFWIVQRAPHTETFMTQDPFVRHTYGFLKEMQIIILSGTAADLVLSKKRKPEDLILLLIFAGGFIFHLFWEAKCQYTIVYFILLIPYAVDGCRLLSIGHGWKKKVIPVFTVIMILGICTPCISENVRCLQKDEWPALQDGEDPYGFTS